ncbi:MAG TPA: hypothetical protein VE913_19320 [Longimicrobium sp.]|nr:hypothetical protein [Longimicrobium sp.]
MTSPARFLVMALVVVVGVKLSEQVYRWAAFRDERQLVGEIRERLLDDGAALTVARAETRARRDAWEKEEREMEELRRVLARYNRHAVGGYLPTAIYRRYQADRRRYDRKVMDRDALFRVYQQSHARYASAADSYTARADSVRNLATLMGEPYYAVPTPLEAAVQRGVLKPDH